MKFSVSHMTVEYRERPMGIETQTPEFGWWIDAARNGLLQTAYQIVVRLGDRIVWDSRRVCSDRNYQIVYEGEPLLPETAYSWELTVWDQEQESQTAVSTFETGLMDTDIRAWEGAKWIGTNSLPLYANALSVFKMSCTLQLTGDSRRAGFLFGGDDPRLLRREQNLMQMENRPGESFCALVLDISGLVDGKGAGRVLVYRQGYDPSDQKGEPLFALEVSEALLNKDNMREKHTLYMECEYGQLELYLDGEDAAHRLLPPPSADFLFNMTRRRNLNPVGRGGDYTCFPVLAKVGLYEEQGVPASFEKLEIRNYRKPCNVLYSGLPKERNVLVDVSHQGNTMLASAFTVEKPVRAARLYATARGIYELYLNGARVGEDYLVPGLSQYDQHQFYQVYDVTDRLQPGSNGIGAVLAEGWFTGAISYTGSNWNYFGDRSALLAKLVLHYEDGSRSCVVTDAESWKQYTEGPVRYASLFQGEVRDLQREALLVDFTRPGFPLKDWEQAEIIPCDETTSCLHTPELTAMHTVQKELDYDRLQLTASPEPGVRVVARLTAAACTQPRPGVYIYDFGQNIAGIPQIEIQGRGGQEITLRFAEVLYPDTEEYADWSGMLMLENIRAALVTDRFILREGKQLLQPAFTFHGYRYMEITGLTEALPLEQVRALAFSSVEQVSADFQCSDAGINRLYQNICWSLQDNFLSIPTDCPQRNERMGWSGDLSVFGRTASYLTLNDPFLRKHMTALKDTQTDGRFADIAPIGGGFGGVLWGSVGITVPWEMYVQYGDRTVLADMYPAMCAYVDFLKERRNENGIIQEGPLGDWLGPENSVNESAYLWQCYYAYDLKLMHRIAGVLGKTEDAERFAAEAAQAREDFQRVYVDPDSGRSVFSSEEAAMSLNSPFDAGKKERVPKKTASGNYLMDTQTSYAVPLALGLFDGEQKKRAAQYLNEACTRENVDDLQERRKPYTLMTGFIGTAWISQALSENGFHETAWRMLKETSYPSWLYPVKNGATTIWERLNSYTVENGFGGNNSMNSFNHYSFGAVGTWMLAFAGGVRRGTEAGTFRICPVPDPDGDVRWAKTVVQTVSGEYRVFWEKKEDGITYRFYIPGGRSTSVELPVDREQGAGWQERMAADERFSDVIWKDGVLAFTAVPGEYVFEEKPGMKMADDVMQYHHIEWTPFVVQ